MYKVLRKKELEKQISEQKILQSELSSLKKNAKVYRQQQNSNIFFLSDMEQEMSNAKRKMDELIQEYTELDLPPDRKETKDNCKN